MCTRVVSDFFSSCLVAQPRTQWPLTHSGRGRASLLLLGWSGEFCGPGLSPGLLDLPLIPEALFWH